MSRRFAIEGLDRFDVLEQKLSMSVMGGVTPDGGAGRRRRFPASGT